MKFRQIVFLTLILFANCSIAQVGINNTNPEALLDIEASNGATPANNDGILLPRIDKFPTINPGADQDGLHVYLTTTSGPDLPGFYYWDNNLSDWIAFSVVKRINSLLDGKSDFDGTDNYSSVFLGIDAGASDDGDNRKNVGLGFASLNATVTGTLNVGVGYNALKTVIVGGYATAVGTFALENSTVDNSTAVGFSALRENTNGDGNTAVGTNALRENLGGDYNTAIGRDALRGATSANNNVAIGAYVLDSPSLTSSDNVGVGRNALTNTTTGGANIAVGKDALINNTVGDMNIAIGLNSSIDADPGTQNIGLGLSSLRNNTNNISNIGIGTSALAVNEADGNIAVGNYSLIKNTTGINNIGIGNVALNDNTTGSNNITIGKESSQLNETGSNNVVVGQYSNHNNLNTSDNVIIGTNSGANAAGSTNVYLGYETGYWDNGDDNVFIGSGAGFYDTTVGVTGSNNVFIGHNVLRGSTISYTNTLWIENSNIANNPLLYGNFTSDYLAVNWNVGTAPTVAFAVNGEASKSTAGAWNVTSDKRLKKNIKTIEPSTALELLTKLRGVTYEWNDAKTGLDRPDYIQYGFIAQELREVFPERVSKDGQGYYQTAYGTHDALFVQGLKEIKRKIQVEDDKMEAMETKINNLERLSEKLEAALKLANNER